MGLSARTEQQEQQRKLKQKKQKTNEKKLIINKIKKSVYFHNNKMRKFLWHVFLDSQPSHFSAQRQQIERNSIVEKLRAASNGNSHHTSSTI